MSTQMGLRGTMFLSVLISKYVLVNVPLAAVTISLNAALVILCRIFISRR